MYQTRPFQREVMRKVGNGGDKRERVQSVGKNKQRCGEDKGRGEWNSDKQLQPDIRSCSGRR